MSAGGFPDDVRWSWSLYGVVLIPRGINTDGHAPTLEAAKAEFWANWKQCLAWAKLLSRLRGPSSSSANRIPIDLDELGGVLFHTEQSVGLGQRDIGSRRRTED
jgi:hypothetical protein